MAALLKYTVAAVIVLVSSTRAFGQADALALSSAVVPPGGTASLNLSLTSPAGSEPAGLEWTLIYSTSAITNITATIGAAGTAAGKVLSCSLSPGSYTCFVTGLSTSGLNANIIQNGVVAVVTATISVGTTVASIGVIGALGATQSGTGTTITATGGTITTIVSPSLTLLTCNSTTLLSGASTTCTVTLNQPAPTGGAVVALSDNNALLTVPASVTIAAAAASATFTATAGTITTTQPAAITATLNGASQTATLSLVAPTLVSSLACNPSSVNSGTSTTCTVTLNQTAPTGGAVVALSDNNALLTVPASVTIAATAASATFTAAAGTIPTTQPATITATLNGASQTAALSLVSAVVISALACNSTNLDSGASSICTLTLSAQAPAGGVTVSVSANNSALTVPASLNVPAGSSMATFTATATTTPPVGESTQTVLVTATLNGASQSESFTLILCPCGLWPSTAQPVNPSSTNKQPIEVGMQFTSNTSGYLTGLQFFKASTNEGTHLGNLWTAQGTHLAEVTFTNETSSGWQVAYFPSPIAITANTTYVISYHAPEGHTAADNGSFTTPVSNLPLQALANDLSGPNGVYKSGSSGFPTTGASATNFWVDVIFNTSATIGTAPPVSVWSSTAVPTTPAVPGAQAEELGLTFMPDLPGYITGVRFYKSSTNLGQHIGYLWTDTGTLLASVTFTNETASGWQQANFATPVAISANTPYVVSYWSPKGHYADDAGYFATAGVTNQMLYAPPNGQYGANGSYATSKVFPASSSNSSNYWVDVVFTTAIQ
jgi:hypothetical protein